MSMKKSLESKIRTSEGDARVELSPRATKEIRSQLLEAGVNPDVVDRIDVTLLEGYEKRVIEKVVDVIRIACQDPDGNIDLSRLSTAEALKLIEQGELIVTETTTKPENKEVAVVVKKILKSLAVRELTVIDRNLNKTFSEEPSTRTHGEPLPPLTNRKEDESVTEESTSVASSDPSEDADDEDPRTHETLTKRMMKKWYGKLIYGLKVLTIPFVGYGGHAEAMKSTDEAVRDALVGPHDAQEMIYAIQHEGRWEEEGPSPLFISDESDSGLPPNHTGDEEDEKWEPTPAGGPPSDVEHVPQSGLEVSDTQKTESGLLMKRAERHFELPETDAEIERMAKELATADAELLSKLIAQGKNPIAHRSFVGKASIEVAPTGDDELRDTRLSENEKLPSARASKVADAYVRAMDELLPDVPIIADVKHNLPRYALEEHTRTLEEARAAALQVFNLESETALDQFIDDVESGKIDKKTLPIKQQEFLDVVMKRGVDTTLSVTTPELAEADLPDHPNTSTPPERRGIEDKNRSKRGGSETIDATEETKPAPDPEKTYVPGMLILNHIFRVLGIEPDGPFLEVEEAEKSEGHPEPIISIVGERRTTLTRTNDVLSFLSDKTNDRKEIIVNVALANLIEKTIHRTNETVIHVRPRKKSES